MFIALRLRLPSSGDANGNQRAQKIRASFKATSTQDTPLDRLHRRRALVASDQPDADELIRAIANRGLVVTEVRSLKEALVAAATLPARYVAGSASWNSLASKLRAVIATRHVVAPKNNALLASGG